MLHQLRLVLQQRRDNAKQMKALLDKLCTSDKAGSFTDAAILSSLPGVGPTVLATLFSYATEPIRQRDLPAFRSLSGIAPVTKQSGKRRQVIMRRSCIHLLRKALYHWVMDRILTIAMAMLRHGTLYDASRFDDGGV